MDELIAKLTKSKQNPIVFEPRTLEIQEIKSRIHNSFVFVKFINTIGGTELGINLDMELTNITAANFEKNTGKLHLVGTCELNFHKLRCIADIDLETRQGNGYIELLN